MSISGQLSSHLPERWQHELKRWHYRRQIARGTFTNPEDEFEMLSQWLKPGDWALDVGANVGHYTRRLSQLVGPEGRVISFEPVPTTFALLTANVQLLPHKNVTLINAAVSESTGDVSISVPHQDGADNFYQARLTPGSDGTFRVATLAIDNLGLCHPIALVKIDVEGHEAFALRGMRQLLTRNKPLLIVETDSDAVAADLRSLGYQPERLPNSPNLLCRPPAN